MTAAVSGGRAELPVPADFDTPPTPADRDRWAEADAAARPHRLGRLRARFEAAGIDAYFGLRREHMRYLTGFALADGEEKVAGTSGQFLVSGSEVVVQADSRYEIQARREAVGARIVDAPRSLADGWAALCASVGARRVGVEAALVPYATWRRLEAAAPDVQLVPVEGWVEADRARKSADEWERVAAACAVADRALAALLPAVRPGAVERDLALALEWAIRTGGAEAIAFEPTCLVGANAALPHGAPGADAVRRGAVVLFDFGAEVAGYRSDMTRTLFVGEPTERDLAVYELVGRAQAGPIAQLEACVAGELPLPTGRELDRLARRIIEDDGRWPAFGHGLGHGIGLQTHELPSLHSTAPETPLPSPTIFSVEPGIYLEGETGVRIEDLVLVDAAARRVSRLTQFPREVIGLPG
ncbi:MAG TPA: Xaa-Pro peptidase family protein [Candidatus Limnocylindrales bacterium]|nr:Xaa-Pro peptidase family protein [Candidatus Limnocylindrales bacterium]